MPDACNERTNEGGEREREKLTRSFFVFMLEGRVTNKSFSINRLRYANKAVMQLQIIDME